MKKYQLPKPVAMHHGIFAGAAFAIPVFCMPPGGCESPGGLGIKKYLELLLCGKTFSNKII